MKTNSSPEIQPSLPGIPAKGREARIWSRKTLKLFIGDLVAYLQLPPQETVWQFAAKNVFLSADVTSEPGYYDPERVPYQKLLQEWMTDKRVNDIVGVTAAQLIKTTVLNNACAYYMKADPAAIQVVYPTQEDGKEWLRDKFMPMIRSSPPLRNLIPDDSTRTTGQTSVMKHFPGGRLAVTWATSPSKLRGRSFRIVIQDDLDGFKDNTEGDPSAQADRRAANQPRALRMKFSTPTLVGTSRIWNWLKISTWHELFVPCPKCGHCQTLVWEQIVGDDANPENTRYRCASATCGALWDDQERYNAVMEGSRRNDYRPRNPRAKIRGFHLNGLYRLMGEKNSLSGFLEEWWRDYMAAKAGGEKTFQVWLNTFLALCYEPASETIEPHILFQRRENYRPTEMLPEEVLVLAASVDVQGNRLECEVRGFGVGQESWGVEYRIFAGNPTEQHVWGRLDAFLQQTYKHPIRGQLRIPIVFVDAGGSKQSEAYKFVETRVGRGVYACRGAKDRNAPMLSPLKQAGYNQVPFYFVGVHSVKDTLHSRLLLKVPNAGESCPGFMHWPISDDYDETYFKNLTAEKKIVAKKGVNKGKEVWECPEGVRNEPWDINVYLIGALMAASFTERQLRQIARDNQRLREQMQLPPKAKPVVIDTQVLRQPPAAPASNSAEKVALGGGPKLTLDDLKAGVAAAAADPNKAEVAPISPPVPHAPRKSPFKVWGKGGSISQFPGGGAPGFAKW